MTDATVPLLIDVPSPTTFLFRSWGGSLLIRLTAAFIWLSVTDAFALRLILRYDDC